MIRYLNSKLDIKSLLRQGLMEPEFYGDLVYKLKKIVGSSNFSAQFIKIISYYKKIGLNINVLQQTACLVVNPIMVGNFAFLFKINCTPVGRTSDSMTVPTKRLNYWWDVRGLMLWLLSGPLGATCWFLLLRYSVLFTVESLSLLYLLSLSWFICSWRWCIDTLGFFMQTKHLCVLINIWTKGEVCAVKPVKALQ